MDAPPSTSDGRNASKRRRNLPSTSDGRNASKRRRNEVFSYGDPNFEAKIMKSLEELVAEEDSSLDEPIDDSDSDTDYTEQSITHQKVDYLMNVIVIQMTINECDSDTDNNNTDNINTIKSQTMQEMADALPEYFLAKNGFKWSSKEPPTGLKWSSKEPPTGLKIAQHNVLKSKPGMIYTLRRLGPKPQLEDIWSHLFDTEILQEIITCYTLRRLGPKPQLEDIWSHLFDTEILQEIITWTNVKLDAVRLKVKEHQKSNYRATDEMEIKALLGLLMLTAIYKNIKSLIIELQMKWK
ncbi:hypothetical protein QE152_g7383 [Popillia japonica]|uniref:Uncharacterized protein n=1 Tax=Popillia japonica TaxID=7064 RepID=A0AAW1MAZ8_POPJA